MKSLSIAQVSPLYESVPPAGYGGTERVVSFLTEELVRRGHRVTLFASGDSATAAELVAPCPRALRLDPELPIQVRRTSSCSRRWRAGPTGSTSSTSTSTPGLPALPRLGAPHVTTLHGRLDRPESVRLWRELPDVPVVSISDGQRRPLPDLRWEATVYHGLPDCGRTWRAEPDDYLAFVGRISPEKRPDRAIEIARRAACGSRSRPKSTPGTATTSIAWSCRCSARRA